MIRRHRFIFSIINAIISVAIFFVIQRSHVLPGNTSKIFHLGPTIKDAILSHKNKTLPVNYRIINTSHDRMLVDYYETIEGFRFPKGNIAITDRKKLLHLFQLLNKANNHKYIICNLVFDQASSIDDSLAKEMLKTKRMVVARGNPKQKIISKFKNLNYGLAAVYMPSGNLSKYRLLEVSDSGFVKSIPLKIYEELNQTNIDYGFFFSKLNNSYIFNDYTVEGFVKPSTSSRIDLGRITTQDSTGFNELTKDKILLIGDFYNNSKKTIYGSKTPSLLILLNAYLSIENGSIQVSLLLILFLFITFFFFSYLIIAEQSKRKSVIFRIPLIGSLIGGARYIITLALIGIVIYFVFGNNLNLIYMGIFFYIENIILNNKYHFNRLKRRLNLD